MSALKNHGPKILLALSAAGCAVFAWMEGAGSQTTPPEFAGVDTEISKIESALKPGPISEKYPFGRSAIDSLKFQEDSTLILERAGKRVETEIPAFVAYPQPSRPRVDSKDKPAEEGELTQQVFAEMRDLGDLKASGDHGRVFVTFKVPQKMKYLEPVRIDVFRGESDAKIDMKEPYATIELAPEDPGATEEKPATADKAEDAATPELSAAARRRKERAGGDEPAPKAPRREEPKKAAEEIPAEFADIKVFADTRVEQKMTYFYKLRMIARMTVVPGIKVVEKDNNGILTKITVVNQPKNATSVKPARPDSKAVLFATPISAAVSATPPSNFEIRLAGTSGKLDPPGTPDFKRSKDYKGTFAVRVWVTDAQVWKDITIQAAPDEILKGSIRYVNADKEAKSFDFNANYKLVEVKWGELVREIEENVPELDTDGNPIMDPKTRKPKMIRRMKKGDAIPNEIAVLEDQSSKKMEDFPKRADFGAREKSLEYYALIEKEQLKADKAFKVRMEKVKERIRASDEERKSKATQAQSEAETQNANPATPPGGRKP